MSEATSRHRIASVEEIEQGSRVIADVDGREIAVFAYDGDYYALANYCVHQSGPLCEGELQGTQEFETQGDDWTWRYDDEPSVIVCPWHAWRFDVSSGENVDDSRYRVPTYEVGVIDGEIYVTV